MPRLNKKKAKPNNDDVSSGDTDEVNTTGSAKITKTLNAKTSGAKTSGAKTSGAKTSGAKTLNSKTSKSKTPGAKAPGAKASNAKAPIAIGTNDVSSKSTSQVTDNISPVTLSDSFIELLGQLGSLRSQLTTVTGNVRLLQKRSDKELKVALKSAKKRRSNGPRAPSGFVKPTKISLELANFLGKPLGTEMARTEVTREINGYIREHKLQDPINGRKILADDKLRKLLRLEKTDELTYFNLQKFMSPHFEKKSANVVVVPAAN